MFIEEANVLLADVIEVPRLKQRKWFRASRLHAPIQASANAFASGASKGVRTQRMPALLNKQRNLVENLVSRSWIRKRASSPWSSSHISRFRPCCCTHRSSGWYVGGLRRTFRVPTWMNARQYATRIPKGVITLWVKKSQATSVFTCSRMNFCQVVSSALLRRAGEGVSPSSFRIRRTDDRPSLSRSLRNSPTMRRYPQPAFSLARRITSSRMLRTILGRPTRLGWRPSLCSITQREYVFGVTMPMMSATS